MIIGRRENSDEFYKRATIIIGKVVIGRYPTRDDRTGKIYHTKYGPCMILNYRRCTSIDVKFLDSGYIAHGKTVAQLANDEIKDYLYKSVCDIGCLGENYVNILKTNKKLCNMIYKRWLGMIQRCYLVDSYNYIRYGAVGVRVDERWHNFSDFYEDFIKLPNYNIELFMSKKLTLDKDKKQYNIPVGNRAYSKDTCELLTQKEQLTYISGPSATKRFIVIFPNSVEPIVAFNMTDFSKEHNLTLSHVAECVRGDYPHHKQYRFIPFNNQINLTELRTDITSKLLSWDVIYTKYTNK